MVELLKEIMKTFGWTQEQVAAKLGVSFQTMNAWVNNKSKPRKVTLKQIRKLYLVQNTTKDLEPTYITLINIPKWARINDLVELGTESDNDYNREAIAVRLLDPEENDGSTACSLAYVANSTSTVVRGTSSAGRIYDKFNERARVKILFIINNVAIARILKWNC